MAGAVPGELCSHLPIMCTDSSGIPLLLTSVPECYNISMWCVRLKAKGECVNKLSWHLRSTCIHEHTVLFYLSTSSTSLDFSGRIP